MLNDLKVPTKGIRTLDFTFSNNDQVKIGVSELYSRSNYWILQAQIKRKGSGFKENKIKPNLKLKKKVNIVLYKKSQR